MVQGGEGAAAGAPAGADGLATLLEAAVAAAGRAPVEPAPDARVSAAFALGWQVAELYRPDPPGQTPAAADDLLSVGRLSVDERAQMALKQIDAAVAKLAAVISAAKLEIPSTQPLYECFASPSPPGERRRVIQQVHVDLMATLTAADFRIGKAYGLGRALADTCRNPSDAATLAEEFRSERVTRLRHWLDDLASALPPHAGHSVGESLCRWEQSLSALSADAAREPYLAALRRQGELWRSMLSSEKRATDMLVIGNYVDAASRLFRTFGAIGARLLLRFWYVGLISLALFAVGVWLVADNSKTASIVAGAGTILAALGLSWKSAGTALGSLAERAEQDLWGAELDTAIADAVTLLPDSPRDHAGRRALAVAASSHAASGHAPGHSARLPAPGLLEPVLDPQRLLGKVDAVGHQRFEQSDALATLAAGQRLPPDHFERLSADIQAERLDPLRVVRASTPADGDGRSAPPPVIYLSRKPTVSQFMSVITECFEAELHRPALDRLVHLGALDHLWRDVELWTEDLRSRFRRFGPCDIRYIEPKLAQLLAGFVGRHAFSTHPIDVRLGDHAKVFVLGDWATGLTQARNVAARVAAKLAEVPPEIDCHVIHLGDTYYSGLPDECRRRFLDLWPVPPGSRVGSWTIPGNHDMYAGGHGYFDVLLGDPRFAAQNGCSYFCLTNNYWQILGLDSGYKDPDRADLQDPQPGWLSGRVRTAGTRGTVLLTHHQPFSAFEEVTAPLGATVARALGEVKVDAWLWGHEHRCAVYDPDVVSDLAGGYNDNARYTAVVGHGGVPNLLSGEPPAAARSALKWQFADYYEMGEDHWGLGGFAVLSFDGPQLEIQYYDEYGKARRAGPPFGYPSEAAGVEAALAARDDRHVMAPDVLVAGGRPAGAH